MFEFFCRLTKSNYKFYNFQEIEGLKEENNQLSEELINLRSRAQVNDLQDLYDSNV